jgi:hypothetical protein
VTAPSCLRAGTVVAFTTVPLLCFFSIAPTACLNSRSLLTMLQGRGLLLQRPLREHGVHGALCAPRSACLQSSSSRITLTPFEQAQLGDECGGYSSPPPCLADPSTPLDQQQDDTEIMLFKVDEVAAWLCSCAAHTAPLGHAYRLVRAGQGWPVCAGRRARSSPAPAAAGQCGSQHRTNVLADMNTASSVRFCNRLKCHQVQGSSAR